MEAEAAAWTVAVVEMVLQLVAMVSMAAPAGVCGAGGPVGRNDGRGAAMAATTAADALCLLTASRQGCRGGE